MRTDQHTLLKVLELIEPKLSSISSEHDLCEIAESLAVIIQCLSSSSIPSLSSANVTVTANNGTEKKLTVDIGTDSRYRNLQMTDGEPETLYQTSTRMLSSVAMYAAERVANLKTGNICRLLAVYSLLPFQADGFIEACEGEVTKRQTLVEAASSTISVEDLLRRAAKQAMSANATVFGLISDDGSSTLDSLKKGLKLLFSNRNDEEKEIADEMQRFTNEVRSLLDRVTASVTEVDACMERIGIASNVHTDTALQRIVEGVNFDLGHCHELIDHYRRIDFSTGRRRSRYDYVRARDLGKRMLSRLIPR